MGIRKLRTIIFEHLVSGRSEDLLFVIEQSKTIGLNWNGLRYTVLLMWVGNCAAKNRETQLAWLMDNASSAFPQSECFELDGNHLAVIIDDPSVNISSFSEKLIRRFFIEFHSRLMIAIGGQACSLQEIHSSYLQARCALSYRFVVEDSRMIPFDRGMTEKGGTIPSLQKELRELSASLTTSDFSAMQQVLCKLFNEAKTYQLTVKGIWELCACIISTARNRLNDLNIKSDGLMVSYEEIDAFDDLESIWKWLFELLLQYANLVKDEKKLNSADIISKAMQYAKEHYMDDIGVFEVARYCFVTPNYFSHFFKQQMGEGFIEWLNRYRIDRAKELLQNSDSKIHVIAQSVGYNSSKYFIQSFKKQEGCTPNEYKRFHSKG